MSANNYDFGFANVTAEEKTARVRGVFSAVAPHYDKMNDLMSGGAHRLWKRAAAQILDARAGMSVLDLAAGSGDMTRLLLPRVGASGRVVAADINPAMLRAPAAAARVCCNGERLPFAAAAFDRLVIAFGLRNFTRRQTALAEVARVLKPGGKYAILEFCPRARFPRLHRRYLAGVLPLMGKFAAKDEASYRYLGESILRFLPPQELRAMLAAAGLPGAQVLRFAAGAVALHYGRRGVCC